MGLPQILLKTGRDYSLRRRHPWVFSGAIAGKRGEPQDGAVVEVLSAEGEYLATGHYHEESIAVRAFSFKRGPIDQDFWNRQIAEAISLRRDLGLLTTEETNSFRLINGEGDSMPGLIVDLYHQTAVLQFHSRGMAALKNELATALKQALGERLLAVYEKPLEDRNAAGSYLLGERSSNLIHENGLKFEVDWERGQKTGFFLDQRENRQFLRDVSKDKSVLNCFSYTGGFSVYALAGGAKKVTSVDSSASAGELLARNIELNGFRDREQSFINADCLQYLHQPLPGYDIIILDPPAFVKHKAALNGGLKGYETINHLAMSQIEPGGLLFTFSCSQLVSSEMFSEIIANAATRAGRKARLIRHLHQGPCHPTSPQHPEGGYLKGLVLRID